MALHCFDEGRKVERTGARLSFGDSVSYQEYKSRVGSKKNGVSRRRE